jgi:hypothetical protein
MIPLLRALSRFAVACASPSRGAWRMVRATMAAALAGLPVALSAAGLGAVAEQSSLGQPLRVAIPLLLGPGEEIPAECFRLVAAERDPEGIPQALFGRAVLERTGQGTRLVVTNPRPVNDPVLRLTVQAGCDRGVRREYTLFMDPPLIDVPAAAGEAAPAAVAAAAAPPSAASRDRRQEVEGASLASGQAAAVGGAVARKPGSTKKAGAPARKASAPAKTSAPRRASLASTTEEPRLKVSRAAPAATQEPAPKQQGPTDADVRAQEELANALEAETVVLRQRVAELTALVDRMQEQVRAQDAQRKAAEEAAKAAEAAKASPMAVAIAWWDANWQLLLAIVVLPVLIAAWLLWRRKGATVAQQLPIARATVPTAPSRFGPTQGQAEAPPPARIVAAKAVAQKGEPKAAAPAASGALAVSELSQITEEARVYVALGHADRAMTVLRDYISSAPRAVPAAWMMLLDLYHANGLRQDFRQVAQEFHQHCNVQAPTWESFAQRDRDASGLHEYPHITKRLVGLWRLPECRDYLERLLLDNRDGKRGGFSLAAYGDILTLLQILDAPAVDIDAELAEEGKLRSAFAAAARDAKLGEVPGARSAPARDTGVPARPTQTSIVFDVDADPPPPPTSTPQRK